MLKIPIIKQKKVECVVTNINDIAGLSIFLINYLIGAYLVVKGNLTIGNYDDCYAINELYNKPFKFILQH